MKPHDLITDRFRLTNMQVSALKRLGISRIQDLLFHLPSRYERAGETTHAAELVSGMKVTLYGTLSKLKAKRLWRSKRPATEGWFEDESGRVKVMWFNQPYIAKMAPQDQLIKLTGTVAGKDKPYITNPEIEAIPPGFIPPSPERNALFEPATSYKLQAPQGHFHFSKSEYLPARVHTQAGAQEKLVARSSLFPVYPESRGITSLWFYHAIKRILETGVHLSLEDPIPASVRATYHLPDLSTALVWVHQGKVAGHAEAARKRFAFEEIFAIHVARARERAENDALPSFKIDDAGGHVKRFLQSVPFPPTRAQEVAISDIISDFEKPHPMARLLEGDVGSGKTLVAAATAYAVVHSRPKGQQYGTLQVAYMAPTEILAAQHFQSFIEYFSARGGSASGGRDISMNIALITGSGCKKFPSKSRRGYATDISRSQLLKWIAQGEIAMLVGTHALIQRSIRFKHLAYAIVDEQHRFGTRQRQKLATKSEPSNTGSQVQQPHFLSMTATPIPRTLALTIYGDLDLSVLDELPPGRAKVTTRIVKQRERASAYEAVRKELQSGRQAYVICPRIEEPDPAKMNALLAKSAKAEAKRLQKDIFPEYKVGLLHGSLKPAEKDAAMRAFEKHAIDILVATSVVEVGINVPNATVMMIEGAERFGLAQLHQLRGRIQRSSHPPYCFLLPETTGQLAMKRLRAMERSSDGFELAESDLETRGAGDLYGRRQWGMSDLGMEALKNAKLIRAAREEAHLLVKKDPSLQNYPALLARANAAGESLHSE